VSNSYYACKLQVVIVFLKIINIFRYTEIWSTDGQSKIIELAEPELSEYKWYPELILVDPQHCVKP